MPLSLEMSRVTTTTCSFFLLFTSPSLTVEDDVILIINIFFVSKFYFDLFAFNRMLADNLKPSKREVFLCLQTSFISLEENL